MSNELVKLRELFAAEAHKAWSGWMDYLFDKSHLSHSGETTIPRWATERWKRQAATPYSELPEQEKQSDREEADRYLQHIPDRDIKALEYRLDVLASNPNNEAALVVSDATEKVTEQAKTIAALTEAVNVGVEKVTEQANTIKALKLTLFQTAESYKVIVGERDATIIRLQELLRRERYEVLHDRGCDCDLCVAVDAALKESS